MKLARKVNLGRPLLFFIFAVTLALTNQSWAQSDAALNFEQAKSEILSNFVDPSITEESLYQYALQGMLAGLNQKHPEWNRLYTPQEYQQLKEDLAGQSGCIGTEITMDSSGNSVLILKVLPNSAAEKAGIQSQDKIIQIGGKSVKGMTLSDVVALLRGNVGDPVNLTLLRNGNVFNATVIRELTIYDTVESTITPNGTSVITIREFNDSTPSQLQTALAQSAHSNPNGIVIDLRQNPGGLQDAMVKSLSLMVPDKTTVAIAVHRNGKEEPLQTNGSPVFSPVPIAVLVDGKTACGAEIMAQALKTNLGAIIVGSQTQGKWNSQTVEEFPNHFAMKYTIATLKGPNGEMFDGVGITPDVLQAGNMDLGKSRQISDLSQRLLKDPALNKAIHALKVK